MSGNGEDEVERPDAPNQELVREDESGPADEGNGGATAPPAAEPTTPPAEPTRDEDEDTDEDNAGE